MNTRRSALLNTPHAFFHRDALCPTLASARRSISSMVSHRAHISLQQRSNYYMRRLRHAENCTDQ
jgi:hypothetical protein